MASPVQYGGNLKPSASDPPVHYGQPYSYEGAPPFGQGVPYGAAPAQYAAGQPYSYGNIPVPMPVPVHPHLQHGERASTVGIPPPVAGSSQWQTGLCGCFEDPATCCITCCLPCITFGRIAEIVDNGFTSCPVNGLIYCALAWVGCPCIYTCTYRTKLRNKFGLPETPCNDCCVHCWCELCALCQEYRELSRRGIDPALGWVGNAHVLTTVPPVQTMTM